MYRSLMTSVQQQSVSESGGGSGSSGLTIMTDLSCRSCKVTISVRPQV